MDNNDSDKESFRTTHDSHKCGWSLTAIQIDASAALRKIPSKSGWIVR